MSILYMLTLTCSIKIVSKSFFFQLILVTHSSRLWFILFCVHLYTAVVKVVFKVVFCVSLAELLLPLPDLELPTTVLLLLRRSSQSSGESMEKYLLNKHKFRRKIFYMVSLHSCDFGYHTKPLSSIQQRKQMGMYIMRLSVGERAKNRTFVCALFVWYYSTVTTIYPVQVTFYNATVQFFSCRKWDEQALIRNE